MPRGGARVGAGRPKKPLADKLIEGNPGKRDLTVLKFQNENQTDNSNAGNSKKSNTQNSKPGAASRLPTYLDIAAKEGGDVLPPASEIYTMLSDFIAGTGCAEFIAPNLIEDFAFLRRGYLECEYMNRKMGRIAGGKRSPYGKPFHLMPWQEQIVRDVFGIVGADGYRQFRTAYVEIGKKNGKSELAAAIALYLLFADGEAGAEVYSCAADINQYHTVDQLQRRRLYRRQPNLHHAHGLSRRGHGEDFRNGSQRRVGHRQVFPSPTHPEGLTEGKKPAVLRMNIKPL